MKNLRVILIILILNILFASQGHALPPKIKVSVSILPQAYFVERIGGQYVETYVLVGPGQSPHSYEPTPKQLAQLAKSQIYFRVGTPFENTLIPKISNIFKDLVIVDTRKGINLRYFSEAEMDFEEHEDHISHASQKSPDPHTWLDPKLVKIQADTICLALSQISPLHKSDFERNCATFKNDLDKLDTEITIALTPLKGQTLYVFHPAFGYFCDSYGLKQVAVEIEGKEPSAHQITTLINNAKKDKARVIFVQKQFPKKTAETIADAIGGTVVPLDPLSRDYINNLRFMAETIKKVSIKN
jgi:zinc transport system substrate-binding protein